MVTYRPHHLGPDPGLYWYECVRGAKRIAYRFDMRNGSDRPNLRTIVSFTPETAAIPRRRAEPVQPSRVPGLSEQRGGRRLHRRAQPGHHHDGGYL